MKSIIIKNIALTSLKIVIFCLFTSNIIAQSKTEKSPAIINSVLAYKKSSNSDFINLIIKAALELPNSTVHGQKILEIFKANKTEMIDISDIANVGKINTEYNNIKPSIASKF